MMLDILQILLHKSYKLICHQSQISDLRIYLFINLLKWKSNSLSH